MMPEYYWDRDGEPMSREDWLVKQGDDNYRRIALDTFADGTFISTVWLGLDHGFGRGRPVIFETMIFGPWVGDHPRDEFFEEYQWRYSSEMRAREAHRKIVDTIEFGGDGDDMNALEL